MCIEITPQQRDVPLEPYTSWVYGFFYIHNLQLPSTTRVMEYKEWKCEVNKALIKKIGLSTDDLPDYMYRDAFDNGMTIDEVVREVSAQARRNILS